MSDWLAALEGAGLALLVKGDVYKFISVVFGETAEHVSNTISSEIRYFNAKRTAEAFASAYKTLREAEIEPKRVSLKILYALLEGISLEEDIESIQSKYKNLLTSAIAGSEIHPRYISLLQSNLGVNDIKLLDLIYKREYENETNDEFVLSVFALKKDIDLEEQAFMLALDNLAGLWLCICKVPGNTVNENRIRVSLTTLGRDFVRVCKGISINTKLK